ncbi:hypothetical protein B0H14DRAFT_3533109 [Mycena olivaceomarginata]|nr:hypothetical protein B0H14DRAFT_3533109 [Mycena olivaceomarginata]
MDARTTPVFLRSVAVNQGLEYISPCREPTPRPTLGSARSDSPDAAVFLIYAPAFPRLFGTAWRVVRRCRGDQDCHVALRRRSTREPARYTSKATLPIPLQSSQLPGSRPSSYTTEKAGGGVKWPPTRLTSRCCSAPSRALSVDSPHPFCVDENPRLTAYTAWDCLPALRTHIASIVFFFGVVQSGIHESVPQSSPRFPIPPRSQCTVSYLRPVSASAHARIIDRPSIAIQASTSSIAYVRSGPRHSEPAAAPYRLRCARCSVPHSDELRTILAILRAHATSAFQALKLSSRPSLVTPPSIQQSRASSDAPDAFSALSTPASLEPKAPRQRARSATGALYRPCHAHRLDTTSVRTQIRPRYQLHAQHTTLAFLAAYVARRLPVYCDSSAVYCCRRLRLLCSPAPPSPPPARAMVVPHSRHRFYRLPQVCLQHTYHSPRSTRTPGASSARHAPPLARAAATAAPHRPRPGCHPPTRRHHVQLLTILHSKPAPVRHREYDAQHRRSAQQVQRVFPVARAAFVASPCAATILCAHAALSSKPRPAAHRERDVHHPRRVALRPSPSPRNLPASHVHIQRYGAPLVDDSATPRPMRSGFPLPAPAAFAAMTRRGRAADERHGGDTHPALPLYPPSALRISDKRGWGTPTSLSATNPSGDSKTYAVPGFHFAPRPVQFRSPASAASSGKDTAGMYIGEVPIRTHISLFIKLRCPSEAFKTPLLI